MKQARIANLVRDLGKTVVEALDKDAEAQGLDDEEHVTRTRSLIEALAWALERQQVVEIDPAEFKTEMRGFAREVFAQRCRRARQADGEPDTANAAQEDRSHFDALYGAKRGRTKKTSQETGRSGCKSGLN
jgi:hypothetical protein